VYPLKPDKIYAHEALRNNPDAMPRMRRFLATTGYAEDQVDWYAHEDAIRVSRELQAWNPDRTEHNWKYRQPLVFTRFIPNGVLGDDPVYQNRPQDEPLFNLKFVLGYIPSFVLHHSKEKDAESGMVCWPSNFLSSADGCSHGCTYCGTGRGGKAIIAALNVEEYLEEGVRKVIEANPWQKCFLLMGGADLATLEPEYGLYEDFANLLAEYDDRYGYFHTNGDCVDWVKDITHRERLMAVWSLCSNEASVLLEPCAPPASRRIDAMVKLNQMGVPVRVKLKPILPIKGWRESYAGTIEELLTRAKPETLGFTTLIWMDYNRLVSTFDVDQLDPTFVEAAREAQEEMKDSRHGPFPHHKRAEIYRFLAQTARKFNPNIPLFISTETAEMWDDLAEDLGQDPNRFFCGCNPVQGPGPHFVPSELNTSNYATNKEAAAAQA
jgi:spore photoproduct lyase